MKKYKKFIVLFVLISSLSLSNLFTQNNNETKAPDPYNNGCNYKALVYDINPPKLLALGWGYTEQKPSSMRALSSNDYKCDPECPRRGKGGHGPGGDAADDRYSFSEGIVREYNLAPEAMIFTDGYWQDAIKVYGGLKYDGDSAAKKLLEATPSLIIPSGGLFGKENDTTLKHVLEQYVSAGGTIIVFAQQYGSHVENVVPIPEGESLKVYGWRQDQSCYGGSTYFTSMHPVVSSCTNERVNVGIDGYFDAYPSSSTLLLNRTKKNLSGLLYYPYGEGTVILTSMFTDWAYAHSQASVSELKLVRDLITFAKNPNLPISMYDLSVNPTPKIKLNVTVKNSTEVTASKVKLKVYTPDRKTVLYETEQSISLSAGGETQIPISFTLHDLQSKGFGICHTDFELYDADNNLIQIVAESDSGRFSLYYIKNKFKPESNYSVWVTAKKEISYWYEQADLELHIRNYKDEPITMDWYYQWTHAGHYVLPEITVPANGEVNYPVKLDLPKHTNTYNGCSKIEMFCLFNRISDNSLYKTATKGINILYPRTRYTYVNVAQQEIKSGNPFNYTISTRNGLNTTLENTEIKVFLERPEWTTYTYVNIATIYEKVFNLGPKETFTCSGKYMHPKLLPMGLYRLRFEITRPDGSKTNSFSSFCVAKNFVHAKIEPVRTSPVAPINITLPDIKVIEVPKNLEITAGGFAQTSIKLKNEGNLRGEIVLRMTAFDTVDEQCEIALDPGEEKEISDIYIDVAGDIPAGNYPFNYTLSGMGVKNGFLSGNFSFKVNGVSLDVSADFEYDMYQVGETGVLTITVNPVTPTEAPLEAVVNWGEYSERVHFNVSSGMEQLVFNIPVDEKRDDKVFYGIYHEHGKGIHLNDIYLNIGGAVNIVLDKQVYAPGDVAHAVFSADESGVITAEAFGKDYTITLSSSDSIDFTVPEHTLGGSYGVSWEFVPSDPLHESVSGGKLFDVSGLVVKVAKSELEKGKYAPGESVKATYTFESNMDESLNLRCWVIAPSGDWEYLGDSEVSVSGSNHVNAATSYSFNTTQAGTHNFVYGLYRGTQLVVSASMGFDVGDAVLIGVSTNHFEYKDGNEDVKVKVDYFGEGTALLEVYIDEELAETRSLNLIGSASSDIVLTSSQVSGGTHNIKALLKKDGLYSEKQSSFIYGTNLPDLSIPMWKLNRDNMDYQYKISVRNSGKTASGATTLIFSDNGTDVETVSIPALQPGESFKHDFTWSSIGKAGTHKLIFEVDRANTVKEFSESNNKRTVF